ncbi:MAG: hypothetical protein Q9208_008516 [Pyrenodesmia sp. 3 TL-2023]
MDSGRTPSRTSAHDPGGSEATFNDAGITTHDEGVPLLEDSMTSQLRSSVFGEKSIADKSGDGSELALESLGDPHDLDNANLRAQGHEVALQRSFSPLAALGLGFSITASWAGYLSNFGQNLVYGGPQNVVFGLLVATVVQWIITLGLSEGQYHFTYILAPTKHKRFAAFTVGWMTLLGWWVITCSGLSLCAVSVAGMVNFWHDGFEVARWQVYLIYLASVFLTAAPLFLSPTIVPRFVQMALYLSVTGFFVIFCMVLGLKKRTQPGSFITRSGEGTSGWSHSTAWVLGVGNALYAYGGTDGAIHIAEEIPRPGNNIPLAMNLTMAIGFSTAFPLFLALMFSVTDLDAVLNSSLPSMEVFYQVTQSRGLATFMMTWVLLTYYTAIMGQWVTAGRMTWAFARDRGVPFSEFFSHVSVSQKFPVRATALSVCFCCLYGLLYLASTTAFNSIVTGAVLYLGRTTCPCCVGHQIVGYAVRLGSAAREGIKVGDRVGVGPQGYTCRQADCECCPAGMENYCPRRVGTYGDRYPNGSISYSGFADYCRHNSYSAFSIPEGLASEDAAVMLCAGSTVYEPLKENGAGPDTRVGIVGLGGLGHLGFLFAKAMGCRRVVAFSRSMKKKDDAMKLGADEYVATAEQEDWADRYASTLDLIVCTVSGTGMPLQGIAFSDSASPGNIREMLGLAAGEGDQGVDSGEAYGGGESGRGRYGNGRGEV